VAWSILDRVTITCTPCPLRGSGQLDQLCGAKESVWAYEDYQPEQVEVGVSVQAILERLFGSKKEKKSAADGKAEPVTEVAPEDTVPEKVTQEPVSGIEPIAEVRGVLDQTVIVTAEDKDGQMLPATGNVFDDTLPGRTAFADAVIGRPGDTPLPENKVLQGLRAAQLCHIGNVRERNEDSSFIFTAESGGQEPLLPAGLYIVADGMGGHHAGHEASRNAARLVAQHVLERIYVPLLRNSVASGGRTQEPIGEVMVDAVQTANHYIHNSDPEKSSGTTLTAALILGKRLYMAHVGDSRAYLYSDGKLKLLTTDHSYVRRLQDAGQLTEAEAAVHPQRNMLYRAVGQGGDLDIDTFTQTLPQRGKLILCSDGLWGLVSDESLTEIVERDIALSAMTDELITMARLAGGHDNITAIIVDFNFQHAVS